MQAEDVQDLYPEFEQELSGIKKIIDHEIKKFHEHKSKIQNTVQNLVKKNKHFIKNVDIEKNNNYYFDNIIQSIKNSSLEEVQFNEIKLKEYIEECNKKEQEEIKNIIKLKERKLNNKIEDLSELKKLNNLIKGI